MRAWAQIAILIFAVGPYPAAAEDARQNETNSAPVAKTAPQGREERTLESFGADNKQCRQWSDGCAVCLRRDDGSFACSLPGIACQPASLTCRQMMQDSKSSGTPEKPAR